MTHPEQLAALFQRLALQAEVARLSTPPDDAEVRVLESWLRNPWSTAADNVERGPIPDWLYALMHQAADALTRLSHALAAEKAKREAMEAALHTISGHVVLNNENDEELSDSALTARATLAKHGGK